MNGKHKTDINYIRCPKCKSGNIEEFRNAFWFLCRDCGHNGMPSSNEAQAVKNFLEWEDDAKSQETTQN